MNQDKKSEFYLGSTSDINRRLMEHNSQENTGWTRNKRWILVYYEAYLNADFVRYRETELKLSKSMKTHLINRIKNSLIEW